VSELELVAPIAQRHNDPIVRAVADFVPILFQRRLSLHSPFSDVDGNLVMPALPRLLVRPPKRRKKGETTPPAAREPFDWRRADGMAVICRVLTALVSFCNWRTQEVRDPQSGYLGVERIALEAMCSVIQAERALYWLRAAKIIPYTRQFREQKPDGSHHSTGNALRKLAVEFFDSIPSIRRVFHHRRAKLAERYGKLRAVAARQGVAGDIIRAQAGAPPPAPAPAAHPVRSVPSVEIADQVHAEHPDWSLPEVLEEARRRQPKGP
jgi:hypothetical protein